MTVSTASIPVLHSAEVAHLYPQVVLPICHGVDQTLYLYQGSEAGYHYEAFTKFPQCEATREGSESLQSIKSPSTYRVLAKPNSLLERVYSPLALPLALIW